MNSVAESPFDIRSTDEKYIVVIDKKSMDINLILEFLEKLRMEYLIAKANFDESIEEIGDDIKRDWWQKNKDWFLNAER